MPKRNLYFIILPQNYCFRVYFLFKGREKPPNNKKFVVTYGMVHRTYIDCGFQFT